MARFAIILILVFTGHVLLVSQCIDAVSRDGVAPHVQVAAINDAAHGDACVHDLVSIVPAPDRPSLGQASLMLLPTTTNAVLPTTIGAPTPDYPRAMARALLQVYRI